MLNDKINYKVSSNFYKNKDNSGYTGVFPDLEYGATEGKNETEAVQMAQDYVGS